MPEIDVRQIARLARLYVEEEEIPRLQAEMEALAAMVAALPAAEEGISAQEATTPMKLRPDRIQSSLPREELLAMAPQTAGGCVVVPKTVE